MKNFRPVSYPMPTGPSPIVSAVLEPERRSTAQALRRNIEGQWRDISRGARQFVTLGGFSERGVFSVEIGGGSRPGMSDATYITRTELARAEEGITERDRAEQVAILEAVDAYDLAHEFVFQIIVGNEVGVYRLRHHQASAAVGIDERPLHVTQIVDTGRAA